MLLPPAPLTEKLYRLSRACASLHHLRQLLSQIIQTGASNHSSSLSALLPLAAASPHAGPDLASSLFSLIHDPGAFAYNSLIRAFVDARLPRRALLVYLRIGRDGSAVADKFTFPFVLKACTLSLAVGTGRAVHAKIVQLGLLSDPYVLSALVRMYSEFGEIDVARDLFDRVRGGDCIFWSSMIGGYVRCGKLNEARRLFDEMPHRNVGVYNAMIGGFVKFGCLDYACRLFEEMPERDVVSWNTMIGAHARSGDVASARELFDHTPCKNVMTWSAIISGFAQSSLFSDALIVFEDMLVDGLRPNQAILVSVLSSCAHLGAVEQGIWIHGYICRQGFEVDDLLGSSLIDMYSKCGLLQGAVVVFDNLEKKDVCSWTSMIYGLAIHGHCKEAIDKFGEMDRLNVRPNNVTFLATLCACSHGGLVEKGREIFEQMYPVYGMKPKVEHYTCMVDLLSRANLAEEARELIESMPMKPDVFVWGAFFGGLKVHGRQSSSSLNEAHICEELARLRPRDSGAYVLVSNIYASFDQWDDVTRMRRTMEGFGIKKNAGCSLIEVEGVVHEFLASGRLHPKSGLVYEMLDQLYREIKLDQLA